MEPAAAEIERVIYKKCLCTDGNYEEDARSRVKGLQYSGDLCKKVRTKVISPEVFAEQKRKV